MKLSNSLTPNFDTSSCVHKGLNFNSKTVKIFNTRFLHDEDQERSKYIVSNWQGLILIKVILVPTEQLDAFYLSALNMEEWTIVLAVLE